MILVGFGNKARHGKDSAAQAITHYYEQRKMMWNDDERRMTTGGTTVGTFKFATALYQEVNEMLAPSPYPNSSIWDTRGFTVTRFSGGYFKLPDWVQPEPNAEVSALAPYGKHPKLLQWWGTDFRRAQDPDYWAKKLFASIPKDIDIALVTDVRFPNEFQGIKERNGFTVRINRKNADGSPFVAPDRPADHPSETALDGFNWDFELHNPHGHAAWLGEQAITLTEYLRGLSGE
jgi:hypothetical protein